MSCVGFLGQELTVEGKVVKVVATRETLTGDRAIAVDENDLYYVLDLKGDIPKQIAGPISDLGAQALAVSIFDGKGRHGSVSAQMLELATAIIIHDLNSPVMVTDPKGGTDG